MGACCSRRDGARASVPRQPPRRAEPGRSSSPERGSGTSAGAPLSRPSTTRPSTTRPSHPSPGPGFVHIRFCIIQASFQFCK